jgi:hypothetical protein
MKWSRDVQAGGCNEGQGCKILLVGDFVEGELYLSWMQLFPSPFIPFIIFIISFFISFFFLFAQEITRGHCLGMVTSGDSVTHNYFHINDKVGS